MIRILLLFTLWLNITLPLQDGGSLEERALAFLDLLHAGQYEQAAQQFDAVMLDAIPPQRLKSVWEETVAKYGPLQGTGEIQTDTRGEYTGVNIRVAFERAQVNVRVVYNGEGKISGLFFNPISLNRQPSPGLIAAFAFSAIFVILLPVVLGLLARRRLGAPWKLFFYGMGIFLVFQLLTRLPMISVATSLFGAQIAASPALTAAWLVILSLTAGIFEEVGRYVGYRWLFKPGEHTWANGIMYGLGHGGIEAIVLVGLTQLSTLAMLILAPQLPALLPPAAAGPILGQIAAATSAPDWIPLLGAFERVSAMALHVALSVIVLQVFLRKQIGWLWLAIGFHTLSNVLIVGLPTILGLPTATAQLVSTVLLVVVGVTAAWVIIRLRRTNALPAAGTLE